MTGGIIGGISGGIEAVMLGGDFFSGSRGGIQYTLAEGNLINGTTPAEYSDEYLYNFKATNYSEVRGVKSMNASSGPFTMENGYFKTSEGPALAATVKSVAAHGRMSDVYFAKAAFSSREQLASTIAHEFAHVKFNLLHLDGIASVALQNSVADNEGHLAIQFMQNKLRALNKWTNVAPYPTSFEPFDQRLYGQIVNLIKIIKFPK